MLTTLAAALVLSWSPSPVVDGGAPQDTAVVFHADPLPAAATLEVTATATSRMTGRILHPEPPPPMEVVIDSPRVYTLRFLGDEGVRITFTKDVEDTTLDGQTESTRQPTHGKTYTAKLVDGAIAVRDAEEHEVSEEERTRVAPLVDSILRPSPLAERLTREPMALGTRIDASGELGQRLLRRDFGLEPGGELEQVKVLELELVGTREAGGTTCGVFAAKVELRGGKDGSSTWELAGEILICTATCRMVSLGLTGALDLSHEEDGLQFVAKGTGTYRRLETLE